TNVYTLFWAQPRRNWRATPFMQSRRPVGFGPSSNTWPRCPPQRRQCTSVRTEKKLRSVEVRTAPSIGAQKLGHPVRLSYFVSDAKRGRSQPAQTNVPRPYSLCRG